MFVTILASIIGFGIVGIIGALPLAFVSLFFGGEVARDMLILGAVLVGSWLPLKIIIDQRIIGHSSFRLLPQGFNAASIAISVMGALVLMPVLWMMTIFPLLIGIVVYLLLGQILFAVSVALAWQIFSIYRTAQSVRDGKADNDTIVMDGDISVSTMQMGFPMKATRTQSKRLPDVIIIPDDEAEDNA